MSKRNVDVEIVELPVVESFVLYLIMPGIIL